MRKDIEFVDPFLRANIKQKSVCLRLMGSDNLLIEIPFQFYTATNLERAQNAHKRKEEAKIDLPPTIASLNRPPEIVNVVDQRLLDESYFSKDPLFADTLTSPGIYGITADALCDQFRIIGQTERDCFSRAIGKSKKYLKQNYPSLFDDEYFMHHPFPYKFARKNLISAIAMPFLLLTKPFKPFFKNIEGDLFEAIFSLMVDIRTDPTYRTTNIDAYVDHLDYVCKQLLSNAKRVHEFILLENKSFDFPEVIPEDEVIDIEESSKQLRIKSELGRLNVRLENHITRSTRNQTELLKRLQDEENMKHLINEASIKPLVERIGRLEQIIADLLNNQSPQVSTDEESETEINKQ